MASKYWLKMYHEALYDPKLASLADNLWRRFWECCMMAGELDEDGFLPPLQHMAWVVRRDENTLKSELGQLAMAGMVELKVDDEGEERWFVSKFAERQSASDAAARMREYRKRKRKEKEKEEDTDTYTYRAVTHVTQPLRNVTALDEPPIVNDVAAAIAAVVKTAYGPGVNEDEFEKAAYFVIGLNASTEVVHGFSEWWARNGYYAGKPALKSFLDEFKNYLGGVETRQERAANGHSGGQKYGYGDYDLTGIQAITADDIIKR